MIKAMSLFLGSLLFWLAFPTSSSLQACSLQAVSIEDFRGLADGGLLLLQTKSTATSQSQQSQTFEAHSVSVTSAKDLRQLRAKATDRLAAALRSNEHLEAANQKMEQAVSKLRLAVQDLGRQDADMMEESKTILAGLCSAASTNVSAASASGVDASDASLDAVVGAAFRAAKDGNHELARNFALLQVDGVARQSEHQNASTSRYLKDLGRLESASRRVGQSRQSLLQTATELNATRVALLKERERHTSSDTATFRDFSLRLRASFQQADASAEEIAASRRTGLKHIGTAERAWGKIITLRRRVQALAKESGMKGPVVAADAAEERPVALLALRSFANGQAAAMDARAEQEKEEELRILSKVGSTIGSNCADDLRAKIGEHYSSSNKGRTNQRFSSQAQQVAADLRRTEDGLAHEAQVLTMLVQNGNLGSSNADISAEIKATHARISAMWNEVNALNLTKTTRNRLRRIGRAATNAIAIEDKAVGIRSRLQKMFRGSEREAGQRRYAILLEEQQTLQNASSAALAVEDRLRKAKDETEKKAEQGNVDDDHAQDGLEHDLPSQQENEEASSAELSANPSADLAANLSAGLSEELKDLDQDWTKLDAKLDQDVDIELSAELQEVKMRAEAEERARQTYDELKSVREAEEELKQEEELKSVEKAKQMAGIGSDVQELKDGGYTTEQMRQAGFSDEEEETDKKKQDEGTKSIADAVIQELHSQQKDEAAKTKEQEAAAAAVAGHNATDKAEDPKRDVPRAPAASLLARRGVVVHSHALDHPEKASLSLAEALEEVTPSVARLSPDYVARVGRSLKPDAQASDADIADFYFEVEAAKEQELKKTGFSPHLDKEAAYAQHPWLRMLSVVGLFITAAFACLLWYVGVSEPHDGSASGLKAAAVGKAKATLSAVGAACQWPRASSENRTSYISLPANRERFYNVDYGNHAPPDSEGFSFSASAVAKRHLDRADGDCHFSVDSSECHTTPRSSVSNADLTASAKSKEVLKAAAGSPGRPVVPRLNLPSAILDANATEAACVEAEAMNAARLAQQEQDEIVAMLNAVPDAAASSQDADESPTTSCCTSRLSSARSSMASSPIHNGMLTELDISRADDAADDCSCHSDESEGNMSESSLMAQYEALDRCMDPATFTSASHRSHMEDSCSEPDTN